MSFNEGQTQRLWAARDALRKAVMNCPSRASHMATLMELACEGASASIRAHAEDALADAGVAVFRNAVYDAAGVDTARNSAL